MTEHDEKHCRDKKRERKRRSDRDPGGAPGRRSASAELSAPDDPKRSGLVQGHALPDGARSKFEKSTGADLSGVRIHTGPESQAAAGAAGADAFAVGKDVHFAAGKFAPDTPEGERLLAHEVYHTLQASGSGDAAAAANVSSPEDAHEREADKGADAMVNGAPARAPTTTAAEGVMHRKPTGSTNSYSAQEGLKWSNGTALEEDEIAQWAAQKHLAAQTAAKYTALAVTFNMGFGTDDLVKKLEKQAKAEVAADIKTRKQEITWLEKELDNWEDKLPGWFSKGDPQAKTKVAEYEQRIRVAEGALEKAEETGESRVSKAAQQGAAMVGVINNYASQAKNIAKVLGSETGKLSPDMFEELDQGQKAVTKLVDTVNLGAKLLDRTSINNFKANPNFQTASAWARHVGGIFKAGAAFAEGLPPGFDSVVAGMMAMPAIITENFIAVVNKYYARLDAEVKDGNGSKLLDEGKSG